MSDESGQGKSTTTTGTLAATMNAWSACLHPEAAGVRWGDPISPERQAELQGYLDQWQAQTDHEERKGPFDISNTFSSSYNPFVPSEEELEPLVLTGADVYWLAGSPYFDPESATFVVGPHLEGANLAGAHLEGIDLHYIHLEGARLDNAHLEGARLENAHIEKARLYEAHLEAAYLPGAHLEDASLWHANLSGTYLAGSHLEGASFTEVHLSTPGTSAGQTHSLEGVLRAFSN